MFKINEKWKIKIRQIVPRQIKRKSDKSHARGNFFSFLFPFKLESLKTKNEIAHTDQLKSRDKTKRRLKTTTTNILQ